MTSILLAVLAESLLHHLALPLARSLVLVWTWTYSLAVPESMRTARRAEIRSDLHEQIKQMHRERYCSNIIAFHILGRMAWGLWDDISWSAPYLPSTLAEHLSRGSDTVSRVRSSPLMVASLAMFGMMNLSLYVADRTVPWFEWVYINAMIPVIALIMKNQHRRWVSRLFRLLVSLFIASAVFLILWTVLKFRLYEMPEFYELSLQATLATLPLAVAMGVATKFVRTRMFKGRWWPVFVAWALIGGACVVVAVTLGGSLVAESLGMTLVTALMIVIYLATIVAFGFTAQVVCYAGIRGTSLFMRLAAAGVRQLARS